MVKMSNEKRILHSVFCVVLKTLTSCVIKLDEVEEKQQIRA